MKALTVPSDFRISAIEVMRADWSTTKLRHSAPARKVTMQPNQTKTQTVQQTEGGGTVASSALLGVMSRVFGVSVDKVTDSNDARKALVNAANDLRGREVMAVMLRAAGLTYRASGEVMGCTCERVRQIEAKGLRKLRHPKRIVLMQGYVRDDA